MFFLKDNQHACIGIFVRHRVFSILAEVNHTFLKWIR